MAVKAVMLGDCRLQIWNMVMKAVMLGDLSTDLEHGDESSDVG